MNIQHYYLLITCFRQSTVVIQCFWTHTVVFGHVYGNILVFRDIIPCKNYGFGHMSWKCLFIYGYATWKYHVFLDMYHGNKYHVFQDVPW